MDTRMYDFLMQQLAAGVSAAGNGDQITTDAGAAAAAALRFCEAIISRLIDDVTKLDQHIAELHAALDLPAADTGEILFSSQDEAEAAADWYGTERAE